MLPRARILIAEAERFSEEAIALLQAEGDVRLADLDRAALLRAVPAVDVLWVRLRTRIDAEVFRAAPRLRIIASATTGLNHIELDEAARRCVRVVSLQGETAFLRGVRATAEHTIGLMLALLRHLTRAHVHAMNGGWNRNQFWGRELYEKTAGVVGYGRLGRIVADCLRVFGCRVLVTDPGIEPHTLAPGLTLLPLDQLLPEADIVTLHVNLDERTRRFFGASCFHRMRPGAWFINTARGELIDEAALLESLRSGALAGAALDVLTDEDANGMGAHPLVAYAQAHDNLIITPHVGGCTFESIAKTEVFLANKVCALLRSEIENGRD